MANQWNHSPQTSSLLWDAPWITSAQLTQTLEFQYGRCLGNYVGNMSSNMISHHFVTCGHSNQHDNCIHLLSCFTNKHINNICINQHNNAIHTISNTLLAHPPTRCFTLMNVGKLNEQTPGKHQTIMASPLFLLPPTMQVPFTTTHSYTMHPWSNTYSQTSIFTKPQPKSPTIWNYIL